MTCEVVRDFLDRLVLREVLERREVILRVALQRPREVGALREGTSAVG